MKSMKSNTQQLKIAEKYLGNGGARFRKYCGLGGSAPWCNAFVSYIFHEATNDTLFCNGAKETYCPHSIKWCYDNLAAIPIYLALPSDVIYFDWEQNGTPNHIGFVRARKSATEIYTIEGNTDGGKVAYKTRTVKYVQAVFRPHFKPTSFSATKALEVDGKMGYNTIAVLQRWLGVAVDAVLGKGTVKALQKKLGVTADGIWGTGTSKALQRLIGAAADGYFGPDSVKALQRYLNKVMRSNPQKLADKAREIAYATNTPKANYPEGAPKAAYRAALNTAYPNRSGWSKAARDGASCDVCVGTAARTSGVDKDFPRGRDEQVRHLKNSNKWQLVDKAQEGDIIVYERDDGGGHICICIGSKIVEAANGKYYPKTTDRKSTVLNTKGKKWVRIYRAR